jgi:hypothetical protein
MIPFDSFKYLNGNPVFAIDGSAVTELKIYSVNGEDLWVGLVTAKDGSQSIETFCSDELFHLDPDWFVNVYKSSKGPFYAGELRTDLKNSRDAVAHGRQLVGTFKLVRVPSSE